MRAPLIAIACAFLPAVATAQAPVENPAPARIATITVGGGNSMGWWGLQAERYLSQGRLSLYAAVGRDFDLLNRGRSTDHFAFAGGLRGYTRGAMHRAFLDLGVSEILNEVRFESAATALTRTPHYGVGLQAGYQFMSRGGFTAMASMGYGYALGVTSSSGSRPWQPLLSFGIGYTFH